MNHTKPRYSVADLIDLLNIGRGTVYYEIKAGRLETYTIGTRRFADPDAVDRYVKRAREEALEASAESDPPNEAQTDWCTDQ